MASGPWKKYGIPGDPERLGNGVDYARLHDARMLQQWREQLYNNPDTHPKPNPPNQWVGAETQVR